MSWWTSVSSLTPIAAWDALHFSGGQLQDQVGSNAITVQGGETTPWPLYALYGQEKPWPLATPIPLSGDFVLMGFVMHLSRGLVFYSTLNDYGSYFLDQESNLSIYQYFNNTGGQVGIGPAFGTQKFMALVASPTSARVYINNDWAGAAFTRAWVPNILGGIGYYGDGNEYNIGSNERFFAAGLWSGVASLADLRALEAACRAALAGPPVGVHAPTLNRLNSPNSHQWNELGIYPGVIRSVKANWQNIYFSGAGTIQGTVKEKGTPDQPLVRQVFLYSEKPRLLVAETWSDADGHYQFENLDATKRYTVVAYDYKHVYRAVIADNLQPEVNS